MWPSETRLRKRYGASTTAAIIPPLQLAAMSSSSPAPTYYIIFATVAVLVLKSVNEVGTEPYMASSS